MKRSILYYIPLIAILAFASCGKDDSDDSGFKTPEGGMSLKLDGKQYSFSGEDFGAYTSGEYLNFTGFLMEDSVAETLRLKFYKTYEPKTYIGSTLIGTYELYHLRTNGYQQWTTQNSSAMYPPKVTFTRLDTANRIASGTFSFKALPLEAGKPAIDITEGVFNNVKYK